MSTLALCGNGMVMPSKYVEINREEMTYIEGGGSVANWIVSGAINLAITAAFGGLGGLFIKKSLASLGQASATLFAKELKAKLIAAGVAYGAAGTICSAIPTVLTLVGDVLNPGAAVAKWLDSKDYKPSNGYFNF